MLTTHGRYPYSPIVERAAWAWPNGTRLAVYIAVNVEHFPFGEGMGVPLAPAQPEPDRDRALDLPHRLSAEDLNSSAGSLNIC